MGLGGTTVLLNLALLVKHFTSVETRPEPLHQTAQQYQPRCCSFKTESHLLVPAVLPAKRSWLQLLLFYRAAKAESCHLGWLDPKSGPFPSA